MPGVGEHLRESRSAVADVFRNRPLRRLNLALVGSVVGDWAYAVAMAVYAYQRGGPTVVGIIGVVRYVSMALLAPLVALLADRFDRRRVMIVADVLRGSLVAAVALIVLTDGPALPAYALTIVVGWVGLAFRPAQSALLPSLASTPSELTAANVTANTIQSVGFFVGPAVAGALLAVTDVGVVVVFDALTFAWSAVMLLGLHPRTDEATPESPESLPPEEAEEEATGGMFAGVGDGYQAILANRDLRLLVALYVAQTVVAGASVVYEVAIALDLLKLSESGVGVLNAALGVGGILGGILALLLSQRGKLARDFGFGVTLWALPLLLVAAWPTLPSALIAMMLIGLGNSIVDVNAETIVQRLVPDEVMGRVFGALDSAAIGGMALGAAAMPLLMSTVGLRSGLVIIGVTVAVVVGVSINGLRRIDRIALAPPGIERLRAIPMLAVLPDHTLERMARTSVEVRVPAGAVVFGEGDAGDRFFIIESGTADVTIRGQLVASLTAGDSFGEIALLRDVPRTATVAATSDLSLRAIDRRHFLPAVTGHTEAS
jgi:MFS family permease